MNRRLTAILLTAFVVAIACSYLVFRIVGNRLGASNHQVTRVVAAARDIKLGSLLTSADLTTIEIAGTLPDGAIVKPSDAIGRGVLSELFLGEPILNGRLATPGSGGGLAATIPDGMRACAVKVDDVVGVAGFVTPGMRVDVLISGNPPGTSNTAQGSQVRTLLQNIQVLSAGTDIQKNGEGKPQQVQVVNLLVTPQQAEALSLASNQTKIQLVLRNPLDTKVAETPGTGLARLYGEANVPVGTPRPATMNRKPATAAPRLYLIEVFNGSKRSEAKFASREENQ
ncbi:MAG TPA: Flp pilus assembly protein CpaB [Acidobacteriaceae bacterium]|jgi:pilus assembly protein CpaB|nr:Flp pilus assembly protein CpaB [Acidobacteriaceae bacterium]